VLPPDRVSADDKLLSSVDAHLLPCAGTLARLITTATALRHQAFQIPWTDGDQRATAAGRQLFSMGFLTTCNFARRLITQGTNLHEHSGENVHLRRDLPCPINVFFFPIPSDMRRFFHSVIRHIFLIVILVIVTLWPRLNDWIRWILQQFLDSQATQGMFRSVAEILVARPQLIPPVMAGSGLLAVIAYCLYDSHFSGKPLLKVTGIPMKGIFYLQAADGGRKIVGTVYVPIENISQGTGQSSIATNLGARLELRGTKLRWQGDQRLVMTLWDIEPDEKQMSSKVDLHPGDTASFILAIADPNRSDTLLPATRQTLKPFSLKLMAGSWLQDRLYIARVTLRGGGIHQTMWFAIYNFQVTDEQPNSIFGPLGLIERVRLRLHLLGLLRAWKPY